MSDDPPPAPNLADLAAATPEEVAEALSYTRKPAVFLVAHSTSSLSVSPTMRQAA